MHRVVVRCASTPVLARCDDSAAWRAVRWKEPREDFVKFF
jgi:hypothetical protein